jgi:hypothetical protein
VLPPARIPRLAAALAIGLASAAATWVGVSTSRPSDYEFWWRGARLLAAGLDPYSSRPGAPEWPLVDPLFYPLPTVVATLPVAWLPLATAAAVSLGGASAALAYVLTRAGWWRLLVFASPGYVYALKLGQWGPSSR